MAVNRIDMTGKRFGRLVVLGFAEVDKRSRLAKWKCICDCGGLIVTTGQSLRAGFTASCGCIRIEAVAKANAARLKTHGMRGSREYRIWSLMRNRCENPNATNYAYYGGRGIAVCESWKSFESFFDDMGSAGFEMTLERINNDHGYCKDNCRWASKIDQANNRSSNRVIEYQGQRKTLAQWADLSGLRIGTLHARLKRGWPIDRALTNVKFRAPERMAA